MSIDELLDGREPRYGAFEDMASISQSLKEVIHSSKFKLGMTHDMAEALDMILHKVARIANGDPQYVDNWTDIIGYARLIERRLLKEQARPDTAVDAWLNTTGKSLMDDD